MMAKLGEQPKIRYQRDGERYIVMLGDDRAGFVKKLDDGSERWSASDAFMSKSRIFPDAPVLGMRNLILIPGEKIEIQFRDGQWQKPLFPCGEE